MESYNRSLERLSPRKWPDYVEVSKYFSNNPLKRCRSTPCKRLSKDAASSVGDDLNLSLSWQLARNPLHAEHKSGLLHSPNCRQADLAAPKRKKRKRRSKAKRVEWRVADGNQQLADALEARLAHKNPAKNPLLMQRKPQVVPLCQLPSIMMTDHYQPSYQEAQHFWPQQQQHRKPSNRPQLQHLSRMAQEHFIRECPNKYAVPMESMYSNVRKGSRYCGNFYYS